MAPRWGWGRKLIGTDAKTFAEIANNLQNHPPAFESCHRMALPPGLNTPPLPGFVAPSEVCVAPQSLPQALDAQPRLGAFRNRAGPDGASPPARVLLSNAHVVPRRPPALMIRVAPYPCSASLQGIGGWCLLSKAGCSSVCTTPWVCTSPRADSQARGSRQGAGLAAGCCSHTSDPRVTSSVVVHPSGMTPMQDHSFGSPGGGPAADITTSHRVSLVPFPMYICFSVAGGAPPFNTK